MKKLIILLGMLLVLPISVLGYSEEEYNSAKKDISIEYAIIIDKLVLENSKNNELESKLKGISTLEKAYSKKEKTSKNKLIYNILKYYRVALERKIEIGEPNLIKYKNVEEVILKDCIKKWNDDSKMITYCINKQKDGINKLNIGRPGDITKSNFKSVRNNCIKKWNNDFSMRNYCENKQFDSIRKLNLGKPNDINIKNYNTIDNNCKEKWNNDFSMVDYCKEKQFNSIRKLNLGKPNDINEKDFKTIRSNCVKKRNDDFSMRNYCENKQFDSIRKSLNK